MKITKITATPVNIYLEAPLFWSVGLYPGTSKTIVEVETDQGLTGLGEAPSPDCADLINKHMGPALTGRDALDIAALEQLVLPEWRIVQNTDDASVVKAFGSIEMALWDLRGKFWEQPLYMLMGGAVRKEAPFTEYFGFRLKKDGVGGERSPEAVADFCQKMAEEYGSTVFEGKLCQGDPLLEIATVKAIRERLGSAATIRLDANMGWSLATARRIFREIEPYNVRNYEDPVATFEEMAELRKHFPIMLSTHIPDLPRAVALGAPDAFVTNFAVLGGISKTIRFIGACETMGRIFWCYSGDAGIASAAYLHMVAAMPSLTEPSQSLFRWQVNDVINEGPFRPRNNLVPVPEGHGLGVTLNRQDLKWAHDDIVKNGPIDHFATIDGGEKKRRLPLA